MGFCQFGCRVCERQFIEHSGGVLNRICRPSAVIACVVFYQLRNRVTLGASGKILALPGIDSLEQVHRGIKGRN